VIVDDLLATGGTMKACHELVKGLGAEVLGVSVLIELEFLKGRSQLPGVEVQSVLRY
jgi:adenine phosphoribosyltransferase